jgi:Pyruvate/2-oxoacid:ferredoxin oxidoreductase delta subunit
MPCYTTSTMPDGRKPSLSPLQKSPTSQGNNTLCACPAISRRQAKSRELMSLPFMEVFSQDAMASACIPIPLDETGMAPRMSQTSLGENGKCRVFEVVLQRREAVMCPFCARSAKRRRLPAHLEGVLRLVRETACIMCSNSFMWCASHMIATSQPLNPRLRPV